MEQLSVRASANLINGRWVQVDEDRAWDLLSAAGLVEESLERVLAGGEGGIRVGLAIREQTMLS